MGVVAHWIKNRRSTALGIITFSTSIGGTMFPVVFRNLLVTVGYARITNLRLTILSPSSLDSLQLQMDDENHRVNADPCHGITNLVCISRRKCVFRICIDEVADDTAPTAPDHGFWGL
jgi:hypothetical protein